MIYRAEKTKNKKTVGASKGALLLEMLIAISVLAIIFTVVANAMFLSLRSNKNSGERDVGSGLASEALEAVRSASEEDWQSIYSLTKSTAHYYPTLSGTKWALSSGDETINLNNAVYTRYAVIDNVSRDGATRNIETTYVSADDDPSTQKVTVTVTWAGGMFSTFEYFFRWKNKVCPQAGWVTGGSGTTVKNCTDTDYDVKDATVDVTGGTIKLQ